jgi:hypothetical protein
VTESSDWNDAYDDVEAMLRAASGYVRASDDLRPRVLEAVKLQSRERRARQWIRLAAMFVLPLALVAATLRSEFDEASSRPLGIVVAAGFDEFFTPTAVAANRSGDGDWRMLDAFTELRRQQAQVLRFAM